ncbi:MAG: transposase, partial [Candidatus Helarchaeota archaeon]
NSQKKNNKRKSRIRNAIERVFAHIKMHYGFRRVRYVTSERNELQFKMICMIYNIRQGLALTTA